MTPGTQPALADDRPLIVERTWPPAPRSAGRARRVLADHLCAWGLPQLTDSAALVVSELVTNAVNHAHPPHGHLIFTRFERLECGVRIEVHDVSEAKPERREAAVDEESGRGLLLVEALTGGHWGVSDRNGPGKTVWAVCADGDTHDATVAVTQ
ncbi:ATP-binding protein [Actinacidiphila acididurans]|uniref:ATP-binding protein n=1 Tax=Actinacidiphila acididurans TaxID=2784346 RepID=A0ABS2U0J2_9ACTN|nr:ATP-binding protein [Actinacidiphila acididurans]MBM9508726.1 ATP-binding protein [Actinacidiphila acididurans]